ncbi:LuxR C-terminal-related transcriptional regulator [Streptomyces collinus]|uniref:LuxR C-terminal-related transcriptional regulator n=1 Tax=Streptomyces collinus TaxID=42684 RepID=UPI0036896975
MEAQRPGLRWPLAGRAEELEALARAWRSQRTKVILLTGPAGVGKTRLADECLAQAVRGGWKGARATATTAAAAVPLGAIAHLLPPSMDMSDPVKGFSQVARLLAGPEGNQRWVILVDDLHLLDASSAVLLRQLLDSDGIRIIATVRSGEPLGDATQALTVGDRVYRTDLTLFRPYQVEEVLQAALSGAVGQRTVRTLWSKSKGNALYLREMVQGAVSAGMLVNDGEIWELAEGGLPYTPRLVELISSRLAAAAPESRKFLELLSLCEPLSVEDAAAFLPADQLDHLEATGLIQVRQDRRRLAVSLAHPLYGESLRAGIPTLRRREILTTQIARTKAHGARRREDALRLATWELLAFGTADAELLVRAATYASHSHDYDRVIALLEGLSGTSRSYESLLLQGNALLQVGRWEEADDVLAIAESCADGEDQRTAVTLQRTWSLFWIAGRTEMALRVNETAWHDLRDEKWQRVLKLNEASLRALSGQHHTGLAMLGDLDADFNGESSIAAWSMAAMAKSGSLAQTGRINEAVAFGHQAYAAHQRIDETALVVPIPEGQLVSVGFALADAGQLDKSRQTLENVLAVTEGTDNAVTWVWASFFRGRTEWLAGDVGAARGWFAQAVARARTYHYVQPLFRALGGLAACAAVLGDLDASVAAIDEMQLYPPMGSHAGEEDLGQAWLHAARGDAGQARATLERAALKARAAGDITAEVILLTDIARFGGAKEVADRLNDLAMLCDGSFSQARARLANALAADDASQLQGVADELQVIGANLLAAEAANAAAAAWRRAGNTRRATAAANQAAACGVHCPGARTILLSSAEATSTLTAREREVALLAAAGSSSKEIAKLLHLSVRTVDNHLQHTYAKLGITTRRELAATLGSRPGRS